MKHIAAIIILIVTLIITLSTPLLADATLTWKQSDTCVQLGGVNAFASYGKRLFIGSYGGVYSSRDNGRTWAATNFDTIVYSLQFVGHTLFAGTRRGLFHSDDAGKTWKYTNEIFTGQSIFSLQSMGSNLIAGTSRSIYRSADTGRTWVESDNLLSAGINIRAVCAAGSYLFLCSDGFGIYRSADTGKTWTSASVGLSNFYIRSICSIGQTVYVGTEGNGILRSTNHGDTWVSMNDAKTQNAIVYTLATDGAFLIAGGYFVENGSAFKGVLAAIDSIPVWQKTGLQINTVSSVYCTPTSIFTGTADGAVYIADDLGVRWKERGGGGLPSGNATTMYSLRLAGNYLFASLESGANGGVYRSADSGRTWAPTGTMNTSPYSKSQYSLYYNYNGGELLAGGIAGVFRSTDYGDSWTLTSEKPANARFLHFKDPYLYRPSYRTLDNGYFWAKYDTTLPAVEKWDMCSLMQYIYIATDSGIYRSNDKGNSWSRLNKGLPLYAKKSSPRILHTVGRFLLAGFSDGSIRDGGVQISNELYYSDDYGDSWRKTANLSPRCFYTVGGGVFANGGVFAGTQSGVYFSSDAGETWVAVNLGIASGFISAMTFDGKYLIVGARGSIFKADLSFFIEESQWKAPTITTPIKKVEFCAGRDTLLKVTPRLGFPPYFFEWRLADGSPIPAAEILEGGSNRDSTLRLRPGTSRSLEVILYDFNGDSAATMVQITVNPLPTPVITAPNTIIRQGDTVEYSAPATTGSLYHWTTRTGTVLPGDTTNVVRICWTEAGSDTLWLSETTTPAGCAADTFITIKVLPSITSVEESSFSHSGIFIEPNPATESFTVGFSSISMPNQTNSGDVTIRDVFGRIVLSGVAGEPFSASGLAAGVYLVELHLQSNGRREYGKVVVTR